MEVINDLQEPNTEEKKEKSKEKEYHLPDGFGLSIEEVQNIINQKCSVSVPKDDPIMLIVPILNAFLFEQQKLQEDYKEGLKEVYQEVLKAFIVEFEEKATKGIDVKVTHTGDNKQGDNKQLTIIVQYVLIVALAITLTTIYLWKF